MADELSLVRFNCYNFFSVLINSRPFYPVTTLLIKIVESLISSEPEPDKKIIQRIRWIYNHTHKEVDEPLSIIELIVFKNLDKGLNRELDIGNKSFLLVQLYKYLDEVSKELSTIVIEIAKKYSIDIPVQLGIGQQSIQSINI